MQEVQRPSEVCLPGGMTASRKARGARPRLTTSRAAEAHREPVRKLMRGAHERSVFGDLLFSDAKFDRAFEKTLDASGQQLGLVVTLGGRVLGDIPSSQPSFYGLQKNLIATLANSITPSNHYSPENSRLNAQT